MEKLNRELNDTKNLIRQLNEQDQMQRDEIARLKSEAKLTKTKQIEGAKTDRKELEEQKRIVRERERKERIEKENECIRKEKANAEEGKNKTIKEMEDEKKLDEMKKGIENKTVELKMCTMRMLQLQKENEDLKMEGAKEKSKDNEEYQKQITLNQTMEQENNQIKKKMTKLENHLAEFEGQDAEKQNYRKRIV